MVNYDIQYGEFYSQRKYVPMSDDAVSVMAKKLYRREIFVSWQIPKHDESMIPSIFMVLRFLSELDSKKMRRDKIKHFISNMADALPMGINGYPIFMNTTPVTLDEAMRINDKYEEIVNLIGDA